MSTNPLALAAQNVAMKWKDAQNEHAINPRGKAQHQSASRGIKIGGASKRNRSPHKRAKSMKAAYSLPNMGIVRLNKLGLTDNSSDQDPLHRRKSGAELNLPDQLGTANEQFVVSVTPPDDGSNAQSGPSPQFSEENNWD